MCGAEIKQVKSSLIQNQVFHLQDSVYTQSENAKWCHVIAANQNFIDI